MKTVIVLGGSYSGSRAAELLAKSLPKGYRIVLIERQSHFNHLYLLPRHSIVPNYAHQAFIPYDNLLKREESDKSKAGSIRGEESISVHASVIAIGDKYVEVDRDLTSIERGEHTSVTELEHVGLLRKPATTTNNRISYDYLIYALGCKLPPPLVSPARTKSDGVSFLKARQNLIAKSSSILICGGGALGIQLASDIACLYSPTSIYKHLHPPNTGLPKKVTLLHSRETFLTIYKSQVHDEVLRRLQELGVEVRMNERAVFDEEELIKAGINGGINRIRTEKGTEYEYDLLLRCTGQKPNSHLLASFIPESINEEGYVRVKSTLQIDIPSSSSNFNKASRIFAIGDVAATGSIKAGHTGWNQASTAVTNILTLIKAEKENAELLAVVLEEYKKSVPMIKVTLGLNHTVSELLEGGVDTEVRTKSDAPVDGLWSGVWTRMGMDPAFPMV